MVALTSPEESGAGEPPPTPPSGKDAAIAGETRVGPASELPPGRVTGAGRYAVGNAAGNLFAVSRRCRHLRADLAGSGIRVTTVFPSGAQPGPRVAEAVLAAYRAGESGELDVSG